MAAKIQNRIWLGNEKAIPRDLGLAVKGNVRRTSIAANIAITPPSLLGMDRRIAYAHRKYHSGLIWVGVTNGLAGIKFSGSVNRLGPRKATAPSRHKANVNPRISFQV